MSSRTPSAARRKEPAIASNDVDGGARAWRSTSDSTKRLVLGCLAGDGLAQKRLYEEFHYRVFRLSVRMVGEQDAADVVQQVFLQVYRNIRKYAGRSDFATWLYRLAVNECLQFRRREHRRRRCEVLTAEPVDGHSPHTMNSQQRDLLERALQRLDPELRAIFLLREVDRLSYSQIAVALKIREGTVGSRLNRARLQLQQHLIDLGWEQ